MGTFLFRSGFAHADNVITKRCSKTITWLFLSRLQGNKPLLNLPKPWNSPPAQTGTLRNLRNLPPEPTPAHTGTLRNLPEPSSGTYTSTHRNPPEPSGTFLRNLLLRPAPAHIHPCNWLPHDLKQLSSSLVWTSLIMLFKSQLDPHLRVEHL